MRILLCFVMGLVTISTTAQKSKKQKELFYLFDSSWKAAREEDAKYFAYVVKLNDTSYRWNIYNYSGPLMMVETYRDEDATLPNGYFAWYDRNGIIDSSGYTIKGKKDGIWYTYSDTLSLITRQDYVRGKLVKTIDFRDPSNKTPADSLPGDREADFRGGVKGWRKYLEKNYKFPARALSMKKHGRVMIDFTIDSTGKVEIAHISRSVEFSLDQEAMRLIRESSDWIPAIQNGKKVTAYRRQPIHFARPQ